MKILFYSVLIVEVIFLFLVRRTLIKVHPDFPTVKNNLSCEHLLLLWTQIANQAI